MLCFFLCHRYKKPDVNLQVINDYHFFNYYVLGSRESVNCRKS